MSEKPILFSGPMVRAILAGTKTQTRRVIKLNGTEEVVDGMLWRPDMYGDWHPIMDYRPYHNHMHLWVRETWADNIPGCPNGLSYRSDHIDPKGDGPANPIIWRSPLFMPRWASRLTLEVTGVKAERLQDITHHDAIAEGIEVEIWDQAPAARDYSAKDAWFQSWSDDPDDPAKYVPMDELARTSFRTLWNMINAKRGYPWESNPWVWAIEFKAA